jgi:hypothetical protein
MLQAFRSGFKRRPIEQQTRGIWCSAIRTRFSSDADYDAAAGGHYALHEVAYDLVRVADESGGSFPASRTGDLHAAAEKG